MFTQKNFPLANVVGPVNQRKGIIRDYYKDVTLHPLESVRRQTVVGNGKWTDLLEEWTQVIFYLIFKFLLLFFINIFFQVCDRMGYNVEQRMAKDPRFPLVQDKELMKVVLFYFYCIFC